MKISKDNPFLHTEHWNADNIIALLNKYRDLGNNWYETLFSNIYAGSDILIWRRLIMKVLVINSGSSSLKYELFDMKSEKSLFFGKCATDWVRSVQVSDRPCLFTLPRCTV